MVLELHPKKLCLSSVMNAADMLTKALGSRQLMS
jgi:hypothetical protein